MTKQYRISEYSSFGSFFFEVHEKKFGFWCCLERIYAGRDTEIAYRTAQKMIKDLKEIHGVK